MIEICCGSYEDALAASRGGAERIELNCALAWGAHAVCGLLKACKEKYGAEGYFYGKAQGSRLLLYRDRGRADV